MLRVALAPCSPFSVTGDLLRESALLARDLGVRLHTHLAETLDEEDFCLEKFGCRPVQYMESLGWTGSDVWYAHAVHLDDHDIGVLAASGTGAAHCPTSNARLGAGIARAADLYAAGVPLGLGVDGAASNESCCMLEEAHHAALFARARSGPRAMTVRQSLELATIGGAHVLGRENEIGSIEVGKLADLALWRLDGLAHSGITTRSRRWSSAANRRWNCCWSTAVTWCAATWCARSTRRSSPGRSPTNTSSSSRKRGECRGSPHDHRVRPGS